MYANKCCPTYLRASLTYRPSGARFPTVVVGSGVSDGAVRLRSWAAGRLGGSRPWSRLNGLERR